MSRVSLKIVGASGQGLNSIGEIVAKGLKRAGYCVYGYREYPSLIKGGHASYQLDVDATRVRSTELQVNVLVALNHHGLELNIPDVKQGGLLVHITPDWNFTDEQKAMIKERNITVVYFPVDDILKKLHAKPILANVLLTSFVWASVGQDTNALKSLVGEKFASKKDLLEMNMQCIDEGVAFHAQQGSIKIPMPKADMKWKDALLISGAQAMGLGTVHAGVRLYAGYPMTPSSPILSYIAEIQNHTGMVIKQAEDEITAAQMVSGAMHMGTRALTGTSGGGFDLMTETLSMNAIIENPTVFILAQRPGPATGLPTWTGQADLLMAVHSAHGEFARCVMSVSDSQDGFDLMNDAFNLAEEFQISVIVMTEKQITEALYTQAPYDQNKAEVKRGSKLVLDPKKLSKLKAGDRYDPTVKNGVSLRWLPGSKAATYAAQGDEHNAEGTVDESAQNAKLQIDKRLRKMEALKKFLPEPTYIGPANPDVLLIGWGSTKDPILDVMESMPEKKIGYIHYTYLWPVKTKLLKQMMNVAQKTILVEGNHQGQLGQLLKMEARINIKEKILKYDGRPFFYDELKQLLSAHI